MAGAAVAGMAVGMLVEGAIARPRRPVVLAPRPVLLRPRRVLW